MSKLFIRASALSLALVALGGLLAGCSSAPSTDAAAQTEVAPSESASPTPEPVPDLTGEWSQSNRQSEENYQAATIAGAVIEVFWVSLETKALYWSGTFEAPTSAGAFSWDSANDTTKTSSAILASGDATKTFTVEDDVISYEVSAMGVTTTVELSRE